ncbi:MAG: terpene cyclase/mutase family protein [Planctomycetes bacterium]|nr:terpene cyclase/mutase family protein [Planctomycetota bacterium]
MSPLQQFGRRSLKALTISVVVLLLAGCVAREPARTTPPRLDALSRACRFLWSQQSADGGWHSETYGLMRSGQSLTPYVLHALLRTAEEFREEPQGARDRALAFIRANVNADGALGMADKMVMDYPTHATSFAIRCLVLAGNKQDRALIDRMCDWLARHQFTEQLGFEPAHVAYGGFGFGGVGVSPQRTGVMDVVHTRNALQALREAGRSSDAICKAAQIFLRMVQRHPDDKRAQPAVPGEPEGTQANTYDGGFYFSPAFLAMNKGLYESARDGKAAYFRSYATATSDGLLALLAAGVAASDSRVIDAQQWLLARPEYETTAGLPPDAPTPWGEAMFHYHLATRAEALAAMNAPGNWRQKTREVLKPRQRADGSYRNENTPLMKEDDPLLCTAITVNALLRCTS